MLPDAPTEREARTFGAGVRMTGTSSIWKWIGGAPRSDQKPSRKALADLERRKAMGERSDLTGRLLGDPPPGRSALEKKIEAERRAAAPAVEPAVEEEEVEDDGV